MIEHWENFFNMTSLQVWMVDSEKWFFQTHTTQNWNWIKSVVEITSPTNYPGEQFFFRKFSCLDFKENDNWMEANLTRWILNLIPPEVCLLWLFPKFYFTNLNQSGEHGNKFACCTRFLNFSTKLVKFSERAEKKEISLKQRDQNWSLINPMVSSWWAIHNYIKNVAQSCMLD